VPALLRVGRQDIDIPAGEPRHVISASYTLPVDVDVHTVYPHAHYRAREIRGYATLPDGTTRPLILIRDWDFNWQDVYRFKNPVPVPAGSAITMEFTYDNSSHNPRNPFQPPQRAIFGKNSSDEMGDLWIQVVPRRATERARLTADYTRWLLPATIAGLEMMLRAEPDSRPLHDELALVSAHAGDYDREAAHFAESVRIAPDSAAAHYNLGSSLLRRGKPGAREHLERAVALDPNYAPAYNNLGIARQQAGQHADAARQYREVLRLEPANPDAHYNLAVALQADGRVDDAIGEFERALQLRPKFPAAHFVLAKALAAKGRLAEAVQHYRDAIHERPDWPPPLLDLAWLLATSPDPAIRRPGEAVSLAERAARDRAQPRAPVLDVLAASLAALGEFERAVKMAETALELSLHHEAEAGAIRQRLDLYKQRKPFVAPSR
jgi:tetratricopeptide (TPR) repeat protein